MDLITNLPQSRKYNAILTIIDQGCSKVVKFLPCTKNITGEGMATLYLQNLVPWFRLPKRVVMDRDPHFISVAQHKVQHTGDVSHLCSKEKTLGVEVYVCVHK